jgi:flagellar hook-length control protein FliK
MATADGDLQSAPSAVSVADILIGLAQPASSHKPAKVMPDSPEAGVATPAQVQSTDDAPVPTDGSAQAALLLPTIPVLATPMGPTSTQPLDVATQENAGVATQAGDAALTLTLLGGAASKEPKVATQENAGVATQAGDAALTLTLLGGAASKEPKVAATASALILETAEAAAVLKTDLTLAPPTNQPNPLPTDPSEAPDGPTFDLATAIELQGPRAARALEAQSLDTRTLKVSAPPGGFAGGPGLMATADGDLQSAPSAVSVATANPQATAAATMGFLPNLGITGTKAEDTGIAATDTAGLIDGSKGAADASALVSADGTSAPITDTNPKPTSIQPQTVPILAAAMMRRIQNGMKEFTLRLDPPELGRVDVRLTVGPDKRVRAVVSTDRPEALKDLALSARDLTRALQEAGLELEENGLSFSMNDEGSSQQNRDANEQQGTRSKTNPFGYETSEAAKPEQASTLAAHLSGPVERWQRARIAMTV